MDGNLSSTHPLLFPCVRSTLTPPPTRQSAKAAAEAALRKGAKKSAAQAAAAAALAPPPPAWALDEPRHLSLTFVVPRWLAPEVIGAVEAAAAALPGDFVEPLADTFRGLRAAAADADASRRVQTALARLLDVDDMLEALKPPPPPAAPLRDSATKVRHARGGEGKSITSAWVRSRVGGGEGKLLASRWAASEKC